VEEGIPILLLDRAAAVHDDVEHRQARHKKAQATYFDREEAAVFERERPRGTPGLHRWLLRRKFLLGTASIRSFLPGATVFVACGGSGMDGEFLAEAGARVITSDISLGAARRASERARKYGLPLASIVADIEALPLRDKSVEVTYVHDGLHHLTDPQAGMVEIVRAARKAISITEPARARMTGLAIRAGIAREFEEAGNRVERLRPEDIVSCLEGAGLRVTKAQRYAIFYRHHPGPAARVLSLPGLAAFAQLALSAAILSSGRFGNKLTVQATRDSRADQLDVSHKGGMTDGLP
jgi:SAM-dependent methyltransferase